MPTETVNVEGKFNFPFDGFGQDVDGHACSLLHPVISAKLHHGIARCLVYTSLRYQSSGLKRAGKCDSLRKIMQSGQTLIS